jgi:hypothetical protein
MVVDRWLLLYLLPLVAVALCYSAAAATCTSKCVVAPTPVDEHVVCCCCCMVCTAAQLALSTLCLIDTLAPQQSRTRALSGASHLRWSCKGCVWGLALALWLYNQPLCTAPVCRQEHVPRWPCMSL